MTKRQIMIAKITKAYVRHYRDNSQTVCCVEWFDQRGQFGRTEEIVSQRLPGSQHMVALLRRATAEGITIERQTW